MQSLETEAGVQGEWSGDPETRLWGRRRGQHRLTRAAEDSRPPGTRGARGFKKRCSGPFSRGPCIPHGPPGSGARLRMLRKRRERPVLVAAGRHWGGSLETVGDGGGGGQAW